MMIFFCNVSRLHFITMHMYEESIYNLHFSACLFSHIPHSNETYRKAIINVLYLQFFLFL